MDGWNHLRENGMATNRDPIKGGIIDKVAMSTKLKATDKEEWFIVFNHPNLPVVDGLSSKLEAFELFEKTLSALGITE